MESVFKKKLLGACKNPRLETAWIALFNTFCLEANALKKYKDAKDILLLAPANNVSSENSISSMEFVFQNYFLIRIVNILGSHQKKDALSKVVHRLVSMGVIFAKMSLDCQVMEVVNLVPWKDVNLTTLMDFAKNVNNHTILNLMGIVYHTVAYK